MRVNTLASCVIDQDTRVGRVRVRQVSLAASRREALANFAQVERTLARKGHPAECSLCPFVLELGEEVWQPVRPRIPRQSSLGDCPRDPNAVPTAERDWTMVLVVPILSPLKEFHLGVDP